MTAPLRFDNFTFGTATASYQIEGAVADEGRKPSIWDTFSHTPGRVMNGDTGDLACDHYHRLESDLDLMASYGINAYRFSIAWPRIVPDGVGPANQAGIDFYSRLVDGLLERGITPVATLYHWDLPQTLEDADGWGNRDTAEAMAAYAEVIGGALGDRVQTWTTLNEPWCAAFLGYNLGVHAPGRREPETALRAAHHLNLAHGLSLQALRAAVTRLDVQYSVTNNLTTVRAIDPTSEADLAAVERARTMNNRIWTGPQLKGVYPDHLFEITREITDWSFVAEGDLATIHQPIDVLGLNWYNPLYVGGGPAQPGDVDTHLEAPSLGDVRVALPAGSDLTEMGWVIDASGLAQMLMELHDEFGDLAIAITENGCAMPDQVGPDGQCHDPRRVKYLAEHLTAVHRAREAGVNVNAYFVWSMLDNFEWSWGYGKRFGITHVDYDTQVRTPKDSARWYSELIRTRQLPRLDPVTWG